ncbi:hypothetical protein [Bacillus tequilensis]|uniref:hypothetical protein n=1 Tax=Bacillus tequilensis TaxID=227866 RepID=UPI003B83A0C2
MKKVKQKDITGTYKLSSSTEKTSQQTSKKPSTFSSKRPHHFRGNERNMEENRKKHSRYHVSWQEV